MAASAELMMALQTQSPPRSALAIPLTALALVVVIGAFFIDAYIEQERRRDLQQWESRLGLVADTKAAAIENMLGKTFGGLEELAANASLQTYLGELLRPDSTPAGSEAATLTYLRNLVLASADRFGLWSGDTPRIRANVSITAATGLALLDRDFDVVVATPGMPPLGADYEDTFRRALTGLTRQASGLLPENLNRPVVVFAVPVSGVMGSDGGDEPIGLLVGIRDAAAELFPLLAGGADFAEDSETLLLELRGDRVVYLSSTRDGAGAMQRSMPASRTRLAAAQAVETLDDFAILDNYAGRPVLQVSRRIARQTWVLAQQVDARQALRESDQRQRFLVTSLSLLLLTIVALAVAAWRHGSSVRARHQAAEAGEQAMRLQKQTELLHAISDNVDVATILVDETQHIVFTNQAMANAVDARIADLLDNDLAATLGVAAAADLQDGIREARGTGQSIHRVMALRFGDSDRVYHTGFIPVERIGRQEHLLLLVFSDITELQQAQRRHESLMRNLVSTLVRIVDMHDPYYAFHSSRVAEVAVTLGRELGLKRRELETLDLAATLAHVGKITIPRDLLVKTEPLTDAETMQVREHVETGLALLHELDFEGPVLETMAQKQEHVDGSGYPNGLTAEQMTLPGKILAVANAFVALVSPRAYREAISVREAVDLLMQDADRLYDRRVVAALLHIAENLQQSWSEWQNSPPDDQS